MHTTEECVLIEQNPACSEAEVKRSPQIGGATHREWSVPASLYDFGGSLLKSICALIVALFVCLLLFGCGSISTQLQGTGSSLVRAHTGEWPSTSKDQWTQGTMPALYQKDPEWSSHPYAEGNFGETGCGPLCLSMVYIFLTGDTGFSPTNLADFATRGGYAGANGTTWSFMSDGASYLGIYGQEIGLQETLIKDYLSCGDPIICAMGPGDFTSEGHFIVIVGVDDQGNFIVRDPNSVERTATTWSYETISSQCRNLWVFSL